MLEVDEDSRLGKELLAGGQRYHAHFVPNEDDIAEFYELACDRLSAAGIEQYEISNFARSGHGSRHNLKYWTRQPYIGFGVDAHSMLRSEDIALDAVRFATADSLGGFEAAAPLTRTDVTKESALEEEFFLGLRLNRGVDLARLSEKYGERMQSLQVESLIADNLLQNIGGPVSLTAKGRLLSNEVFERLLLSGIPS
jgi:oxygen-independent coproporphyrinogen-3 oxidase